MSDKEILKAIWCHIENVGKEEHMLYKALGEKSVATSSKKINGVHFCELGCKEYINWERVGTTLFFFPKKGYVTKKYIYGKITDGKGVILDVHTEVEELVKEYEEKLDLLLKEKKEEEEKKKKEFLNNLLC